jgi:hypothetical protein
MVSILDYSQFVFVREMFDIFLEKIVLREIHLRVVEKVYNRGN